MTMFPQRIEVSRLTVNFGLGPNGQVVGIQHIANAAKKLFVVPGKSASIEIKSGNFITITDFIIGPFGIEYVPLDSERV